MTIVALLAAGDGFDCIRPLARQPGDIRAEGRHFVLRHLDDRELIRERGVPLFTTGPKRGRPDRAGVRDG